MSNKALFLGLITLLGFPLLAYLLTYGFLISFLEDFLALHTFRTIPVGYGLMFGFIYGMLALLFIQAPVFDKSNYTMERVVESLKLHAFGGIFLSFCAGFGEELFFRHYLQHHLGVWITSIVFIAIHGYLNPWNWRFSLYGLILLPFIVLLSFGYYEFGLWFAIASHFAYDAVLFLSLITSKDPQ